MLSRFRFDSLARFAYLLAQPLVVPPYPVNDSWMAFPRLHRSLALSKAAQSCGVACVFLSACGKLCVPASSKSRNCVPPPLLQDISLFRSSPHVDSSASYHESFSGSPPLTLVTEELRLPYFLGLPLNAYPRRLRINYTVSRRFLNLTVKTVCPRHSSGGTLDTCSPCSEQKALRGAFACSCKTLVLANPPFFPQ